MEQRRGHGADPLLSLVSHLEPDMVDTSSAVPNEATMSFQGLPLEGMTPSFQGFPLNMAIRMQDVSPESGGFGDPTIASAEQGKAIFEAMVSHVSALVQKFGQMDTRV